MAYIVTSEGRQFTVDIRNAEQGMTATVDGARLDVAVVHTAGNRLVLIVNNEPYSIVLESDRCVAVNGEAYDVEVIDERVQRLAGRSGAGPEKKEATLKAIMPGLVVEINVTPGEMVRAGDGLLIVEAMKMQNELKAGRDGRVKNIHVRPGQTVNTGDTLVTLE